MSEAQGVSETTQQPAQQLVFNKPLNNKHTWVYYPAETILHEFSSCINEHHFEYNNGFLILG